MKLPALALLCLLLVGCEEPEGGLVDQGLGATEGLLALVGLGAGVPLVRGLRSAVVARREVEQIKAAPSRASEDVAELYRRVERLEAMLMQAGLSSIARAPQGPQDPR